MILLGLTGSIGMGKTTTAAMFRELGIPVHDADAAVHALYRNTVVAAIEQAFPGTTGKEGVDRKRLGDRVIGDEAAMRQLEKIVHPLVEADEAAFVLHAKNTGVVVAILDNPLLFEMKRDSQLDGVIVVTAPLKVQKQRVIERQGMDEGKFQAILASQYPDAEKRKRADFIIDTSLGMKPARDAVKSIVDQITSGQWVPAARKAD